MSLPWFRLYTEIIDDPKTGTLSDSAFRTYIELLCLARQYGDDGETGMTPDTIDWKLRRNASVTLQELLQANLVTANDDETIAIPAFSNRQRKSDTSAERVRKCRENKKKKECNVTETLEERSKSKKKIEKETNNTMGKNVRFSPPSHQEVSDYCLERNNSVDPQRFIDHYTSNGWMVGKNKMKDWKAAIRTWEKNHGTSKRPDNKLSEVDRVRAINAKRADEREANLQGGRQDADAGGDFLGVDDRVLHAPLDKQIRGYGNS